MKECFRQMTYKWMAILHTFLFLFVATFSVTPWYFLMLTVAQILFVPLVLRLVLRTEQRIYFLVIPAIIAVSLLQMTGETKFDILLAFIYLLFTLVVATYGFKRFVQRGFSHLEEFAIDMGFMYLFIGGLWFFASIVELDTEFSPILTWLTGIHFHYSSFLLPIFIGFLGRIYKPIGYKLLTTIILISPMVVAIGITFSTLIEFVSVILYIIGIYGFIILSLKTTYKNSLQKRCVVTSFGALGITIIFSLLYTMGNAFGLFGVTIDFMLKFHGFLNCVVFATIGVVGWSIWTPPTRYLGWSFPVSNIMGKWNVGEKILSNHKGNSSYSGLVDDMNVYVDSKALPSRIIDFYENTQRYRLFSEVSWHTWFKPFAVIYKIFSKKMQQLNLPISSKQMEMTGNIVAIEDGRMKTRAWIRKVEQDVIFVALYSLHQKGDKSYMNIALPLPWSTMIGILELHEKNGKLLLTSKRASTSDAGIYLAFGNNVFKLPLEEQFLLEEKSDVLTARHQMRIFSVPFLTIKYKIIWK
ncbi:hypothetical protein GI482_02100 [Bacillus sp. N3536]|nr:hypothetical protein GI482_02100 [Bacillus sp. N3536]